MEFCGKDDPRRLIYSKEFRNMEEFDPNLSKNHRVVFEQEIPLEIK